MTSKCLEFAPNALAWPWAARAKHLKHQVVAIPRTSITVDSPISTLSSAVHPLVKEEGGQHVPDVWLPEAPNIPRPKAQYNAATLAYLGDCIYELYVRCHFLAPPQAIDKYNTLVMSLVCCEAQDAFLKFLLNNDFLSEEERDIVRWGKNVQTSHKKATKRAGAAVYSRASSLETLIGFLYLTNKERLQEVMQKLGFTWTIATKDHYFGPENTPPG